VPDPAEPLAAESGVELAEESLGRLRCEPIRHGQDLGSLSLRLFDQPLDGGGGAQEHGAVPVATARRQEVEDPGDVDAVTDRGAEDELFGHEPYP
jgi:hypothetical protein